MSETEPSHNVEHAPSRPFFRWMLGIFVLALLIRLIHLFQIRSEPLFEVLINESFRYNQWAGEIAAGPLSPDL